MVRNWGNQICTVEEAMDGRSGVGGKETCYTIRRIERSVHDASAGRRRSPQIEISEYNAVGCRYLFLVHFGMEVSKSLCLVIGLYPPRDWNLLNLGKFRSGLDCVTDASHIHASTTGQDITVELV